MKTCSRGPHPLGRQPHGAVCRGCYTAERRGVRKAAPLPAPRKLPVATRMREGIGERFADCGHEAARLDEFIASRGKREADAPAFCPPRCQWRTAAVRLRAVDYMGAP